VIRKVAEDYKRKLLIDKPGKSTGQVGVPGKTEQVDGIMP